MATTTTPATGTERIENTSATDNAQRPLGARIRRKEDPRFGVRTRTRAYSASTWMPLARIQASLRSTRGSTSRKAG